MRTTLKDITDALAPHHLCSLGLLQQEDDTIVLIGPLEPGFWDHVCAAPEFHDTNPDPLDRWSKRVICDVAARLNAAAIFPSDGPPYPPFMSWALASGRAWSSPVGMLVHDTAGLLVSYRGALRLPGHIAPVSETRSAPCTTCARPCLTACPVSALEPSGYDVAACKAHIRTCDSASCQTAGCAARRACPISQQYARAPQQSAFHMRAFLRD